MQRASSHRKRRRRGAASIEAALLLPLFAIVLATLLFVARDHLTRAQARGATRRCAFVYAVGGCTEVPDGCAQALATARADPEHNEAARLRADAARDDSFGVLSHVPLLGDAIDGLFGTTTTARIEHTLPLPWGKAAARVVATMTLSCNERARDVGAAIRRVFCDRVPLLECGAAP